MYPDQLDWLIVVCCICFFTAAFLVECWMAWKLRQTTKLINKRIQQFDKVILGSNQYIQLLIDAGEYEE